MQLREFHIIQKEDKMRFTGYASFRLWYLQEKYTPFGFPVQEKARNAPYIARNGFCMLKLESYPVMH